MSIGSINIDDSNENTKDRGGERMDDDNTSTGAVNTRESNGLNSQLQGTVIFIISHS
jgi:hypothetical protein